MITYYGVYESYVYCSPSNYTSSTADIEIIRIFFSFFFIFSTFLLKARKKYANPKINVLSQVHSLLTR